MSGRRVAALLGSVALVVLALSVSLAVARRANEAKCRYTFAAEDLKGYNPFPPNSVTALLLTDVSFSDPRPWKSGATLVHPVPVYLVNDPHAGYLALYRRDANPESEGCWITWNEAAQRFEEPCYGSRYTRTGDWIEGPSPRGMDRFGVAVDAAVGITLDMCQFSLGKSAQPVP
jgi:hypothetical protein